jgi:hypothetical protein
MPSWWESEEKPQNNAEIRRWEKDLDTKKKWISNRFK